MFEADNEEDEREDEFTKSYHRYDSFAPVRHEAQVKYFIDGHDYCWAVAEAIENARQVIFIEDWWLYLRRPPAKYPEYRIDNLLKRKAEEGVKIFVVVYKEVSMALTINSEHTRDVLENLHENIIVQRSPDFTLKGLNAYWSHHEKYVVVDNKIAFLGGLDLCFGRWDTHAHHPGDFFDGTGHEIFPGQDYNNARVRDFEGVNEWDRRLIDKTSLPRMPWHDVSLCMVGGPVLDVGRHFTERWNYIKTKKNMDNERVLFLKPALGGFGHHQHFSIPDDADEVAAHRTYRFMHGTRDVKGTCRTQILRSAGDWSLGLDETEHSIQNAYIAAIHGAEHYIYIENQFFITSTEKDDDFVIKNAIGEAIVKRINRAHEEREPFKVYVLMPLMPGFPAELSTKEASNPRMIMHYQYISICRGGRSIIEKLEQNGINASDYISFYSLRNYDKIARQKTEEMLAQVDGYSKSYNNGYGQGVEGEVEYAAVSEVGDGREDKNHDFVSEELYIHSKLLIVDDRLVIMGSANLNDRSQCGERDSEIALLVEDQDMIPSQMNGKYYEAGRFAATLRRQLWKEHLGLLTDYDRPLDEVTDDMLPLPVPQVDHTESEEDRLVMDPLSEETINYVSEIAANNTDAFRQVFHCVPEDSVHNWDEYKEFYPDQGRVEIGHVYDRDMPVEDIRDQLSRVRGHLVEFPLEFLKDEDLAGESIPFITNMMEELYT
ncbi:hypothetical protein BDB00DRAFT_767302 [Zychaea mexicana]|uniref:uncharacterized protein n=1 Tax=Zychaea mexicana TaxID=64656 RepID=UPI0022FF07A0|nr:uncharacterized protein BDB00DRAFT_767302 [Zychaea mexicana]KAI9491274.1 hypothetical protein BDB00DRAFT_767302 [Zychaea mexicana]